MQQSTATGRNGNFFGRDIAKKYAKHNGLVLAGNSNECVYNNEISIIKSAKKDNSLVGICVTSLDRVVNVILLKETSKNIYEVYISKIVDCITDGKATASKGKAKNFSVKKIIEIGTKINCFRYEEG